MCENVFTEHPEAVNSQNFLGGHFVFIKCCEICIEAIEMPVQYGLATGARRKPLDFLGFFVFFNLA